MRHRRSAVDTKLVTHAPLARARTFSIALLAVALLAAIAILPAGSAAAGGHATATVSAASWDSAQQRQVVAADLMSESGGSFDGAGPLTAAQANAAMVALAARLQGTTSGQSAPAGQTSDEQGNAGEEEEPEEGEGEEALTAGAPTPAATPSATSASVAAVAHTAQSPVTVATFDRMLVEDLGLADVAAHVQAATAVAGLRPPAYFGSEVVARLLELRYEHPVGAQRLDLFPDQPITRAEAAWSLAQVIGSSAGAPRRQLGDSLLRPGRLRAAAERKLARELIRLGPARDQLDPPPTAPSGPRGDIVPVLAAARALWTIDDPRSR